MPISLIVAVVFVVFLGALTRMTFGFGEAVVSMPLLTLLPVSLHTAVSLMGLVGLTVALLAVTIGWRQVYFKALIPLIFAALIGIPIGLVMVTFVPMKIMTGLLGAALISYGTYSLTGPNVTSTETKDRISHPLWGLAFGFASGVFGSAYNFNGVPVAIYGTLRGWRPHNFRSTMQAYFLISGTLIVAGQGVSGMWNVHLLTLYLASVPAMVAAFIVGTMLHRNISSAKFQRYIFLLISVLGIVLFLKSAI